MLLTESQAIEKSEVGLLLGRGGQAQAAQLPADLVAGPESELGKRLAEVGARLRVRALLDAPDPPEPSS